jgi:hypothetical protein
MDIREAATPFPLSRRTVTVRSWLALRRRYGAVLTLIYVMAVVVGPVAHLLAERGSLELVAATHLHAPGTDCPAPHDEQHCPACHFAGLKILSGAPLRLAERAPVRVATAVLRGTLPAAKRFLHTQGPRAPPLA